jgi:redox-regulated HSP33 family molecular chaperone
MQEKEDTRKILELLMEAKKREILENEENIKKCKKEIKEFEKMLKGLGKEEN